MALSMLQRKPDSGLGNIRSSPADPSRNIYFVLLAAQLALTVAGAFIVFSATRTRTADDEKNRLCRPSSYGNSLADWARMNVRGSRNTAAFSTEPDVKAWTDAIAVNPARIPPGYPNSAELDDAVGRLGRYVGPGVTRLAELGGLTG